jgi:hypothetical protein
MVPSGCRTAIMSMAPLRCGVTYANVLPTAMPAANVPLCAIVRERTQPAQVAVRLDIAWRAGIRTQVTAPRFSGLLALQVGNRSSHLQTPAAALALSERPALPSMVVELALASELAR